MSRLGNLTGENATLGSIVRYVYAAYFRAIAQLLERAAEWLDPEDEES